MNTVREVVDSVIVDASEAKGYLIEYLVNEAVAKHGHLIRKPQSCTTWGECFTIECGLLIFWFDTEDHSTHTVKVAI